MNIKLKTLLVPNAIIGEEKEGTEREIKYRKRRSKQKNKNK